MILGDLQFIAMYGLVHEFRLQNSLFFLCSFFFFFSNYKGTKEKVVKPILQKAAINLVSAGVQGGDQCYHMLPTTCCKSFIGS